MKPLIDRMISWLASRFWRNVGFVGLTARKLIYVDVKYGLIDLKLSHNVRHPIIIVGKELCYEVEKVIPVDSYFEAQQIAHQIPFTAPFEGIRKVHVEKNISGGVRALISVINEARLQEIVGELPPLLIPVSWLIPALVTNSFCELEIAEERLCYSVDASMLPPVLVSSDVGRRDFWLSMGVDVDQVSVVPSDTILERLPEAFRALTWFQWFEGFRGGRNLWGQSSSSINWPKISRVVGIFLIGYLSLISIVLGVGGTWSQSEVNNEPLLFKDALALKGSINRLSAEHEEWNALVGEQYPVWAIWPTLQEIAKDKVAITSLKYESGVVEIFVMAEDATDVLDDVISSPFTSDAAFGAPVQKDPRTQQDRFSVTWKVVDDGDGKGEQAL